MSCASWSLSANSVARWQNTPGAGARQGPLAQLTRLGAALRQRKWRGGVVSWWAMGT